jgi:hypothetical protein
MNSCAQFETAPALPTREHLTQHEVEKLIEWSSAIANGHRDALMMAALGAGHIQPQHDQSVIVERILLHFGAVASV